MGVAKRTRKFATARDLPISIPLLISLFISHHDHDLSSAWVVGDVCVDEEHDDKISDTRYHHQNIYINILTQLNRSSA